MDRYSLKRTYFTFIRPKLEYACVVWDNCSAFDKERLESFQLEIARIVTGARRGTSHELLYNDLNWLPLTERRKLIKMKKFSKIVEGSCPEYLTKLLPEKVDQLRPNSRNADNFQTLKCRTETFKNSFIPSTINLWNELPSEARCTSYFTQEIRKTCNPLFYEGSRLNNVKHAQLRMNCSKLNGHLFLLHVSDSAQCVCGHEIEDTSHFLLHCPLYDNHRQILFDSLRKLNINVDYIDINLL